MIMFALPYPLFLGFRPIYLGKDFPFSASGNGTMKIAP